MKNIHFNSEMEKFWSALHLYTFRCDIKLYIYLTMKTVQYANHLYKFLWVNILRKVISGKRKWLCMSGYELLYQNTVYCLILLHHHILHLNFISHTLSGQFSSLYYCHRMLIMHYHIQVLKILYLNVNINSVFIPFLTFSAKLQEHLPLSTLHQYAPPSGTRPKAGFTLV